MRERDWSQHSRSNRIKKKLEDSAQGCLPITAFFPLVNKIELVLKENENLKEKLITAMKRQTKAEAPLEISNLLKALLDCAAKKAGKTPGGMRYDSTLREMASLIFALGGNNLYQILAANLPLPSIATVRRNLYSTEIILEGDFRFRQLKKFLLSRNYPLKVWISEDATRISGRIQYCPKTNQIVGFVPPLGDNGVPVVGSFPASSAKVIADYFDTKETSNYAYCVVVQPLAQKAPSFCLALFGSNNQFVASDVLKRWNFMLRAAKEEGVEIVGFSSDGDPRLLKAMLSKSLSSSCPSWSWFNSSLDQPQLFIQDHIHIAAKLKSKLLKPSGVLPMGKNLVASRGHLVELIKTTSKDQHELSMGFINPKDKMNYRAVEKLCSEKVTNLLRQLIHGSEATATYLDMIRQLVAAFNSPSLRPHERIEIMWEWVLFLRIWRTWIQTEEGYTLTHNFITLNTYMCIELNAHNLIHAIRKFRNSKEPHLFLPLLYSSQPCEELFRGLRSMTSTFSTVVNFSLLEMENRIKRLDFMSEAFQNLDGSFAFPRSYRAPSLGSVSDHQHVLPEDDDIEKAMNMAMKRAVRRATELGIFKPCPQLYVPNLRIAPLSVEDGPSSGSDDDASNSSQGAEKSPAYPTNSAVLQQCEDFEDALEDLLIVSTGSLGLRCNANAAITPNSPFVQVLDGNGKNVVIRKSTLCWLLSTGDSKLSSDRLQRVQCANVDQGCSAHNRLPSSVQKPCREETISVGAWCAFKSEDESTVIGRILAFSFLTGRTVKNQEFSGLTVSTNSQNERGVGCLCSWFKINSKMLTLSPISMELHGYYDVKNYLCTIPRPKVVGKQLQLVCTLRDIVQCK